MDAFPSPPHEGIGTVNLLLLFQNVKYTVVANTYEPQRAGSEEPGSFRAGETFGCR